MAEYKYINIKPNQVISSGDPIYDNIYFYIEPSTGKLMVVYQDGAPDPSTYLSISQNGRLIYEK